MFKSNKLLSMSSLFGLLFVLSSAHSAVFKFGDPEQKNGMAIQALYIQSVKVEGGEQAVDHSMHNMGSMPAATESSEGHDHGDPSMHAGGHNMTGDIHLEASVKASASNDWGFPEGSWIPYLRIHYTVKKTYENYETSGMLIPMAANDGPHYGNNVTLDGPGKYTLKLHVSPPDGAVFMRHFDKETGVDGWWETFEIKRNFTYIGVGKKGGY